MSYVQTLWVEGLTPLSPANMNKMERGVRDAFVTAEAAILKPAAPVVGDVLAYEGGVWTKDAALDANARLGIKKAGTLIGSRRTVNFVEGSGATLTIADDSAAEEVDVTITGSTPIYGPEEIYIYPFLGDIVNVNWSTIAIDAAQLFRAYRGSSGAQNAEIEFDFALIAGTWTLEIIGMTSSAAGIITVYLDGVSKGTIDQYQAGAITYNSKKTVTGIVVAATGKKRLKLKMETKHASSTGYAGYLSLLAWRKTA